MHEGGFRVSGRVPQGLVFHRPDGSVLPVSPPRVPINGTAGETLKQANRRAGLEISPPAVDSLWDGEVMDIHMAVECLNYKPCYEKSGFEDQHLDSMQQRPIHPACGTI